jgi:hypothetical protein
MLPRHYHKPTRATSWRRLDGARRREFQEESASHAGLGLEKALRTARFLADR